MSGLRARLAGIILLAVVGLLSSQSGWGEPSRLPSPLTLVAALSAIDTSNPILNAANASIMAAQAAESIAQSSNDVSAIIEGRARWIEPSELASNQSHDDSVLSFRVSKRLYDSGSTHKKITAAKAARKSKEYGFIETQIELQLRVLAAYFSIIEADIQASRDIEAMSVSFVQLQRQRERQELGQVSELQVLEKESEFQRTRRRNQDSQLQQRVSRSHLALLINRPHQLPENVSSPTLGWIGEAIPDYEQMVQDVLSQNPAIKKIKAQLTAKRAQLRAEKLRYAPALNAEFETAEYQRDLSGRDRAKVSLVLTIPLGNGNRMDAETLRLQADIAAEQAALASMKLSLNQQVLEVWRSLQVTKIQIDESNAERDFRELYLDRSRALYEFEQRADLGDAMVRTTDAQFMHAQARHAQALAWARLHALQGRSLRDMMVTH